MKRTCGGQDDHDGSSQPPLSQLHGQFHIKLCQMGIFASFIHEAPGDVLGEAEG